MQHRARGSHTQTNIPRTARRESLCQRAWRYSLLVLVGRGGLSRGNLGGTSFNFAKHRVGHQGIAPLQNLELQFNSNLEHFY
jgi:hypothetical protein